MDLARPAGPTLKITRHRDARLTGSFGFEVWNPFAANYQPASSLADGLRRVDQLASLIAQMHARKHPKQAALADAPTPTPDGMDEWAEFRINPAGDRSYDTRRAGHLAWTRSSGGKARVTEMVCSSVGYAQPPPR